MVNINKRITPCFAFWILIFAIEPPIAGQGPVRKVASLYGEVVNLHAEVRDLGDTEVMAVGLSFKMKVHNSGTKVVRLGDSSYLTLEVQFRKGGTQEWRQLMRSSLVYGESIECSACETLAPGRVRETGKVESQITRLRKLWPDPAEVEFRLLFEAVCRQDGQLHLELLSTAPFRIDIKLPENK